MELFLFFLPLSLAAAVFLGVVSTPFFRFHACFRPVIPWTSRQVHFYTGNHGNAVFLAIVPSNAILEDTDAYLSCKTRRCEYEQERTLEM